MFKKHLVISSEFTKNTITLILGTAIAHGISISLQPLLRRIYPVEDFGAISIYLSILGVLSIMSSLRYESAIVLPKSNDEGAALLILTFFINTLFVLGSTIIILLFKDSIIKFINFPIHYANYFLVLPLATYVFSIYQCMNYWLIRQKSFGASTKNKIIRRGTEGGVQIVLGIFRMPGGLFIGDLIGNFANVLAGLRYILKSTFRFNQFSYQYIKEVAYKYRQFPLYNLLPTLLSSFASVLPFLLVNKFYSTETVGYLDLAKLVLSIPLIFISSTISQVLFQSISERKNNGQSLRKEIRSIIYMLLFIIGLEIIVIFTLGPQLFGWIFGSDYQLSGYFSQILIFSFIFNFISSTFSCVFIVLNKIKLNATWQIFYFAGICSLIFFKDSDIKDFLGIFVAIDVVFHASYCFLIYSIVKRYERSIIK